jgi:hypothetical protein
MSRMARRLAAATLSFALLVLVPAARAMGGQDCAPEALASVDGWLASHPWRAGATTADARVAAACRPWLFDRTVLIVAAAYAQDKEQDKNLVVALVDATAGAIRSAFQGVVVEDETWSVTQGSLRIDTAPYDLAPGVRAFGIDVSSPAPARTAARAGVTSTRTLFVQDGPRLRLVLDGLVLTTWEKVTVDNIVTTSATIAVAAHRTNDYADLLVTRTVGSTARGGVARHDRTTLLYDGSHYGAGAPDYLMHQVAAEGAPAPGAAPRR